MWMLGEVIEPVSTSWELFQSPGELSWSLKERFMILQIRFPPLGLVVEVTGLGLTANQRSVLDSETACCLTPWFIWIVLVNCLLCDM